jgi:hypothetical protein
MRYDFDALVFSGGRAGLQPSIMTFGGDRERFGLPAEANAFLIENDVWQFSPLCGPAERFDAIEPTGRSTERRRRLAVAHDAMTAVNERPLWNASSSGRSWPTEEVRQRPLLPKASNRHTRPLRMRDPARPHQAPPRGAENSDGVAWTPGRQYPYEHGIASVRDEGAGRTSPATPSRPCGLCTEEG